MIWSLQAVPELSDQQFAQWSRLLEERAGIFLKDQQRTFLQTQVSMRMRELGLVDFSEYYDLVVDGVSGMVEWTRLIDRLVVKETRFFRHKPSLDYVQHYVLGRMDQMTAGESLDVWSVGCATGEEPYTLAMVINDVYLGAGRTPRFSILATDISRAALSLAKAGIYNDRKMQTLEPGYQKRYFHALGKNQHQIAAGLRERICFSHGNVLNIKEMPVLTADIVFCQNLLVYFRRWLREQILNAFVERLKPGGALVIGLGEVVEWTHPAMKRVSTEAAQVYLRSTSLQTHIDTGLQHGR